MRCYYYITLNGVYIGIAMAKNLAHRVIRCVGLATTSALVFSACTLTPGSHVPSNTFGASLRSEENDGLRATRIMITPALVKRLEDVHQTAQISATPNFDQYAYRIQAGDVLSVVVWDHPELTAPFGSFNNAQEQGNVVREDGTIYYPFIGAVQAGGRTALEIRNEMEVRLSKYIESPQVDVRVAGYRSQRVFIAGSVLQPGTLPITDVPLTIVDAINAAGGLADQADLFDVRLSRGDTTYIVPLYEILFEGNTSQNAVLKHGDVVHVAPNEQRQIFLMGEVLQPQAISLTNRPMSLTQALAAVGGIQEARADGRGVYVIRNSEYEDIVDVYQLDISRAWAFALGDQFVLEARDVVYVSAAPITRWNRWVSNILPSLQGAFNIDRVGRN